MRLSTRLLVTAAVLFAATFSTAQAEPQELSAKIDGDKVVINVGDKLFTCYKFSDSQKYPYFWPVNGPLTGQSITTETSEPYPHHHSLFFGCDRVNGGNYWQDVNARGQIISEGPRIFREQGARIMFSDQCRWKQPDKDPIIEDRRFIVISAPSETQRIIDFRITMTALVDIEIQKTNHSLFSARVVPELSVKSGGTLINAAGDTSEKGTFGVNSPWCDYSGSRDGKTEGIAILQNPMNQWFPAKWFTRDYGFFSPTPMYWLEGNKYNMAKGERLSLGYRVIVHTGDSKEAGIETLWTEYEKSSKERAAQRRSRGQGGGPR